MEKEIKPFTFDPDDYGAMLKLMEDHGEGETISLGTNVLGEDTTLSVSHDRIDHITYQHNGWIRRNVYWRDGTREEIYSGRWDKKG